MTAQWTVGDIVSLMERWYPTNTAETWDRVGLVLGDIDRPVRKILLAVDPIGDTVAECVADECDMMITHHPLYLRGTSFLPETDPKGHSVAQLIRANTALYCAHTNADIASDGVAACLADLVGVRDSLPLKSSGEDRFGSPIGLGRIGTIDETTIDAFSRYVASVLPAGPHGLFVSGEATTKIRTVAVSGGAGDSLLDVAREAGADIFLTADLRHHPASEHLEVGSPALLCGSHWATEWPWLPRLASKLMKASVEANVPLEVEVSTIVTEPWTRHLPTLGGTQ